MSGPIVRTGTNPAFWANWDNVFSGKKGKGTAAAAKGKKSAPKKSAAKKAAKPAPAKKAATKKAAPKKNTKGKK